MGAWLRDVMVSLLLTVGVVLVAHGVHASSNLWIAVGSGLITVWTTVYRGDR